MENIHVIVRIRPLNPKEIQSKEENIWQISPNTHTMDFKSKDSLSKINSFARSTFSFDEHYSPSSYNKSIYDKSIRPLILTALEGINTTVFMYGQTGSGKTYTILGEKGFLREEASEVIGSMNTKPASSSNSNHKSSLNASSQNTQNSAFNTGANNTNFPKPPRPHSNPMGEIGVLLLSIGELFEKIRKDEEKTYMVKCSYVEIYNDNIYDLLKPLSLKNEIITINEDQNKEFFLKGVTEQCISSCEEIIEMLKLGEINRHYAETNMNHVSSRSHTIFRIAITAFTNSCIRELRHETLNRKINLDDNLNVIEANKDLLKQETLVTESFVNFVDLAGSEKITNGTGVAEDEAIINEGNMWVKESNNSAFIKGKERVREGQFINKSLFFLTQVIALKSEGKSNLHIPYRNSPLTKILKSSLGGNSRTMIILCINPTMSNLENSLTSLRFGVNAKKIQNKIETNIVTKNEGEAFKRMVKEYEKKLTDQELAKNDYKSKYELLFQDYKDLLDRSLKLNNKPQLLSPKNNEHYNDNQDSSSYLQSSGVIFLQSKNKTCNSFYPFMKKNFQDLLYDNVGKYAVMAFYKIREKMNFYKEFSHDLQKSQTELVNYHLAIYSATMKIHEKLLKYKQKYKRLNKFNTLSNESLQELQKTFSETIEIIKNEQIHRVYKEKINGLMKVIENQQNHEKSENKENLENVQALKNLEKSPNLLRSNEKSKKPSIFNDFHNFSAEKKLVFERFLIEIPSSPAKNFDFNDFESNFLNNPLDFSYLFEKKEPIIEPLKSPISISLQKIDKLEKPERSERNIEIQRQAEKTQHKKTKSLLPQPKRTSTIQNKRVLSVEKNVKKSEKSMKLKDLIEDKRILAETFVLNQPARKEKTSSFHENRKIFNFKEDAENLRNYVQKVSETINENMGRFKNNNIHENRDYFNEENYFSNKRENEDYMSQSIQKEAFDKNQSSEGEILKMVEKLEKLEKSKKQEKNEENEEKNSILQKIENIDENNKNECKNCEFFFENCEQSQILQQISVLSGGNSCEMGSESRLKKRRTRAERNSLKKE